MAQKFNYFIQNQKLKPPLISNFLHEVTFNLLFLPDRLHAIQEVKYDPNKDSNTQGRGFGYTYISLLVTVFSVIIYNCRNIKQNKGIVLRDFRWLQMILMYTVEQGLLIFRRMFTCFLIFLII